MTSARALAERLTHRVVVRRRLPPPLPRLPLYTSTEGGLRYLRPSLRKVDQTLIRVATRCINTGDVVWDVGANLGLFALAAAASAGPTGSVLAMEPDSWLVSLLRRTAVQDGARAPIEVLPVAASRVSGLEHFNIARRNRSTSHLEGFGSTQTGGTRAHQTVCTMSLDHILDLRGQPTFVKIDVEGAELEVLSGATALLASGPSLLVEVAGEHSAAINKLLRSFGYRIYDADQSTFSECDLPPYSTLATTSRQVGTP